MWLISMEYMNWMMLKLRPINPGKCIPLKLILDMFRTHNL